MQGLSCVPRSVYDFLYQFKPHFRCAQGRHFVLFCWLVVALMMEQGKGTIKALARVSPERIRYGAMMRMIRSGQWSAQELLTDMVGQVLVWLPGPADGVLHLIGDTTLKGKRGRKHPLGRKAKMNEYSGYTFGFEVVLLVAHWGTYRLPVAMGLIDPQRKGHQNILFRQMLRQFEPPTWARQVMVEADAGFAANRTFQVIEQKKYHYVFAVSRTRKFTDGKHLKDLIRHLPKCHYHRIASYKPDCRRKDYWVYCRRVSLHHLGDVTLVLSKHRRNNGPKKVKIIVTNLPTTSPGQILSHYARRWGVEVTIKELKSGLHLGQMQVTRDADRVERSVLLSAMAYLVLIRLYGRDESVQKRFSLFQLKLRFATDVFQEQLSRSHRRWRKKLDQYRLVA